MLPQEINDPYSFYKTQHGQIYLGDSLNVLSERIAEHSADLIMTSPPFGLVRKKRYGNADADEYLDWFRPFATAFKRSLKENGSLVIDIGGAWVPGQPTRSLYSGPKSQVQKGVFGKILFLHSNDFLGMGREA